MGVNWTYYGIHFSVYWYVSEVIMLNSLDLELYVNYLNNWGKKVGRKHSFGIKWLCKSWLCYCSCGPQFSSLSLPRWSCCERRCWVSCSSCSPVPAWVPHAQDALSPLQPAVTPLLPIPCLPNTHYSLSFLQTWVEISLYVRPFLNHQTFTPPISPLLCCLCKSVFLHTVV